MEYMKKFVASFDVDPQNCFTPYCSNELPVEDGHNIVGELSENHKLANIKVISKEWHHPEALHIASQNNPQYSDVEGDYPNMDIYWNRHGTAGTFGSELILGLPKESEYGFVSYKGLEKDMHPYGGCYHDFACEKSTGVIEFLKANGVEIVVVGGLALDYCVKETCLQLVLAGFKVFLNLAATRGISDDTVKDAMVVMEANGVILCDNSEDIEDKLNNYNFRG